MRKIVHVLTTIDRGGAENAVLLLAKLQRAKGNHVTVVPLKGIGELRSQFEESDIDCDMTLMNRSFFSQCLLFKRRYGHDYLFHGHLPRAELLLALTKGNTRYFVTRHNAEPFYPGAPSLISKLFSRFVARRANAVIAISRAVREHLIESSEVNSGNISVIYYGYEPIHSILKSELRERQNGNFLKLVCVSRLVPQKNLHFLLQLFRILQEEGLESSLDIFGSGSQLDDLVRFAQSLKLSNVRFLGRAEKVVELLGNYDFFVLTSRYEGFGLVLLEAMDASVPIIAPKISAIPEVLGEQHFGLFESENLSDCKSKIIELLHAPSKTQKLVEYQRLRLSLFSTAKYFEAHDLLYERSRNV